MATDNSSGCTASATLNVTVINNPNTNLIAQDTITECSSNTVQLQVSPSYSNYIWSNGSTASSIIVNTNGWYSVSVVDNSNCKMKDSVYVSIGTLPILNLNSNSPLCEPDSLILQVLNPDNSVNYNWFGPAGTFNGTTWIISPSNNAFSGIYSVVASQNNSLCTSTAQLNVTVNPHPNTNLIAEDTLYVCDNNPITISAGNGYIQYIWNNGSNQSSIIVDTTGTFYVTVKDNNQCKITDQVVVEKSTTPQFYLTDQTLCDGDTILLYVSLNNTNYQYIWNNGITDSLIVVTNPGTYILTVTNACGSHVDTSVVTLKSGLSANFQLPNVISPHSADGNNDIFDIAELSNISEFKLSIFNRWGFLLFETSDPSNKWDGKYNGNLVPAGVYFVVFDYKDCIGNSKIINSTLSVY
jgi:gliding motility-associated-like protein